MSDVAIKVEGLGKKYLIGHNATGNDRNTTFREAMSKGVRDLARKSRDMLRGEQIVQGDSVEEFWALKDVSFEIKRGDTVGIIGRNGAGKSTLLKILSRITEPTTGRVSINGRVASLLEVGTGFHPELTGRENIFLNGAILGMSRAEIQRKFDEIVNFSGVERFLDTPVKRYSSGMYVRLAFAVAAHLEPEILIVDEVLAVGDAEFQKKCLGKMESVSSQGRTVIFVSHDLSAVERLCRSALLLASGEILCSNKTLDVIEDYRSTLYEKSKKSRFSSDFIEIFDPKIKVVIDSNFVALQISIPKIKVAKETKTLYAFDICDDRLVSLAQTFSIDDGPDLLQPEKENAKTFMFKIPPLIPGRYHLSFWLGPDNNITYFHEENFLSFEILTSPSKKRVYPHTRDHGCFVPMMEVYNVCA